VKLLNKKFENYFDDNGKVKTKIYTKNKNCILMPYTKENLEYLKSKYDDRFIIVDTKNKNMGMFKKYKTNEWYQGRTFKMYANIKEKAIDGFPVKDYICQFCLLRMRNATLKCKPNTKRTTDGTQSCAFEFLAGKDFEPKTFNAKKDGYVYIKPSYVCKTGPFFSKLSLNNVDFDGKLIKENLKKMLGRAKISASVRERNRAELITKLGGNDG